MNGTEVAAPAPRRTGRTHPLRRIGVAGLVATLAAMVATAVAFYLWRKREGAYVPLTIDVLRVTGGAITEIVTFHDDQFPRLGLPERLAADGTE